MKYIVLSFDDGLHNFIDNALPILDEFKVKASINIVGGFSDNTNNDGYKRLTPEEIKSLCLNGHEIANHSDSHVHEETYQDFEISKKKILSWTNVSKLGAVMPYNQRPTTELEHYFLKERYSYVALAFKPPFRKDFAFFRLCIMKKLLGRNNRKLTYAVKNYYLLNDINMTSKLPYINRVGAYQNVNAQDIFYLIKHMSKKKYASIMFHSIIKSEKESFPYREGTWFKDEFRYLISRICSEPKKYKIITQMEAVNLGKK